MEPKYVTIKTMLGEKEVTLVQAKYWSVTKQCWLRVFHTYEIPEEDWDHIDHGTRIQLLRMLSENTPKINKWNWHKFL